MTRALTDVGSVVAPNLHAVRLRVVLTTAALGLVLACGGIAGSNASEPAKNLCAHAETEKECPCSPVGLGEKATIDGVEIEVLRVVRWTGKSSLPEIQNSDERAMFAKVGENALVVEVAFTNTKPVKAEPNVGITLLGGDGEKRFVAPYNSNLYMTGKDGWMDLWNDPGLGPGRTRNTALVFAVPKGEETGALLWLQRTEKRPDPADPRGRLKTFTVEQAVLDLPSP